MFKDLLKFLVGGSPNKLWPGSINWEFLAEAQWGEVIVSTIVSWAATVIIYFCTIDFFVWQTYYISNLFVLDKYNGFQKIKNGKKKTQKDQESSCFDVTMGIFDDTELAKLYIQLNLENTIPKTSYDNTGIIINFFKKMHWRSQVMRRWFEIHQ